MLFKFGPDLFSACNDFGLVDFLPCLRLAPVWFLCPALSGAAARSIRKKQSCRASVINHPTPSRVNMPHLCHAHSHVATLRYSNSKLCRLVGVRSDRPSFQRTVEIKRLDETEAIMSRREVHAEDDSLVSSCVSQRSSTSSDNTANHLGSFRKKLPARSLFSLSFDSSSVCFELSRLYCHEICDRPSWSPEDQS